MKNGRPSGPKKSSKSSHWAPMVELFEILWGFERMYLLMCVWFGKKSAKNRNDQRLWQTNRKNAVGLGGVGGRGGVPGKRKSWGFEVWRLKIEGHLLLPHWRWRRIYGLLPLPPTSDCWFECLGFWIMGCGCVFGVLDCGFVVLCVVSSGSVGLPRWLQIGLDSCR